MFQPHGFHLITLLRFLIELVFCLPRAALEIYKALYISAYIHNHKGLFFYQVLIIEDQDNFSGSSHGICVPLKRVSFMHPFPPSASPFMVPIRPGWFFSPWADR